MRLASYNVENLFNRPKVMNLATWAEGKAILDRYGTLNGLLGDKLLHRRTPHQDGRADDRPRPGEIRQGPIRHPAPPPW